MTCSFFLSYEKILDWSMDVDLHQNVLTDCLYNQTNMAWLTFNTVPEQG